MFLIYRRETLAEVNLFASSYSCCCSYVRTCTSVPTGDFYLFLDLSDMCGRPVLVSLIPGAQVPKTFWGGGVTGGGRGVVRTRTHIYSLIYIEQILTQRSVTLPVA